MYIMANPNYELILVGAVCLLVWSNLKEDAFWRSESITNNERNTNKAHPDFKNTQHSRQWVSHHPSHLGEPESDRFVLQQFEGMSLNKVKI